MSPRALAVLALCTVLAAAAAVWTLAEQAANDSASTPQGASMFPALTEAGAQLEHVLIQRADYMLALNVEDGVWIAPEHGGYPVSAEVLNRIVSDLAGLRLHGPKTRRPEWYRRIGVEDPESPGATSIRVRLVGSGDDVPADVILGRRSRSLGANPAGGTFVRRMGEPRAWLAEGTVTVPPDLSSWFGSVLEVPGPRIRRISIAENGSVVLRAEKPEGEAAYRLVQVGPRLEVEGARVDDEALKRLAGALVSIAAEDVRPAPDPATRSPERTLRFETEDGLELVVTLLDVEGKTWATFKAAGTPGTPAQGEAREINRKTASRMFLLERRRVDALNLPLASLVAGAADREAARQ